MPIISVSAEAEDENFSLSDSEEAQKAKTMIASRMRRRQKQKRKPADGQGKPSLGSLVVDDGEESGLTDVETVEVEHDGSSGQSKASTPAEDFTPIFEAVLQQHITQIIDDHEGNTHVNTIVKGVVATLDDSDVSEEADDEGGEPKLTLMEALTDIEDLDDSGDESEQRSDNSELNHVIGQLDLGGDVSTSNQEEELAYRPAPQLQPRSGGSMLLSVSSAAGRKKPRKTRSKKQKAASTASGPLLSVANADEGSVTDVESVSGVEDSDSHPAPAPAPSMPGMTLSVGPIEDEGATDVEDFRFSDDDEKSTKIVRLAPGIMVTGETSETESYDCSGRSSRLGLTDVESVSGVDEDVDTVPLPAAAGLLIPLNQDDPVTDVEDIDNVEEDAPPSPAPVIPRNGPAYHAGQQHVVTIQEDENGRVTSRKYSGSPGLLGFVDNSQREEGVSDVEYISVEEDHVEDDHSRGVTPEIEMFAGSTVRVRRHSLSEDPSDPAEPNDSVENEADASASHYSLMPPTQAAEILTDTEDMDMSDGETVNQGQMWLGQLFVFKTNSNKQRGRKMSSGDDWLPVPVSHPALHL